MSQFRRAIPFWWEDVGGYVKGRWQAGKRVDRQVMASVQPMSYTDVHDLPEGERFGQMVKVYTSDDSIPVHGHDQRRVRFTWRGKQWIVIADEAHFMGVIEHRKLIARLETEGEGND